MFTYEFDYIPIKVGEKMIARVEQDDEVINVTIGDTYLGTMIEDSGSEYGFVTDDEPLQAELPDFSMAFKEALAVENLPAALHQIYGQNLIAWTWTDEKNLKLIAHPDVDLVDFAETIRDQIYDVVLFAKPLIVYLSKEGSGQVEEINVNC